MSIVLDRNLIRPAVNGTVEMSRVRPEVLANPHLYRIAEANAGGTQAVTAVTRIALNAAHQRGNSAPATKDAAALKADCRTNSLKALGYLLAIVLIPTVIIGASILTLAALSNPLAILLTIIAISIISTLAAVGEIYLTCKLALHALAACGNCVQAKTAELAQQRA